MKLICFTLFADRVIYNITTLYLLIVSRDLTSPQSAIPIVLFGNALIEILVIFAWRKKWLGNRFDELSNRCMILTLSMMSIYFTTTGESAISLCILFCVCGLFRAEVPAIIAMCSKFLTSSEKRVEMTRTNIFYSEGIVIAADFYSLKLGLCMWILVDYRRIIFGATLLSLFILLIFFNVFLRNDLNEAASIDDTQCSLQSNKHGFIRHTKEFIKMCILNQAFASFSNYALINTVSQNMIFQTDIGYGSMFIIISVFGILAIGSIYLIYHMMKKNSAIHDGYMMTVIITSLTFSFMIQWLTAFFPEISQPVISLYICLTLCVIISPLGPVSISTMHSMLKESGKNEAVVADIVLMSRVLARIVGGCISWFFLWKFQISPLVVMIVMCMFLWDYTDTTLASWAELRKKKGTFPGFSFTPYNDRIDDPFIKGFTDQDNLESNGNNNRNTNNGSTNDASVNNTRIARNRKTNQRVEPDLL